MSSSSFFRLTTDTWKEPALEFVQLLGRRDVDETLWGLQYFLDVAGVTSSEGVDVGGADYVAYYFPISSVFGGGREVGVGVGIGVVDQNKTDLWREMGELETPDVGGHAVGDGVSGDGWGLGCAALGRFWT